MSREEEIRKELLDNQTQIEEARNKVGQIPQVQQGLKSTKQQLAALAQAKGEEIVKKQEKIAEERSVRQSIQDLVKTISDLVEEESITDELDRLTTLTDASKLIVGRNHFDGIVIESTKLKDEAAKASAKVKEGFVKFQTGTEKSLKDWGAAEEPLLQEIERKRAELAAQGIKLDLAYIKKLADDKAKYERALQNLALWKKKLAELDIERKKLLAERWSLRDRMYAVRTGFAKKASDVLKGTLGDLQVSVRYQPDGFSLEGTEIIQRAMGWRTNQVPRANILANRVTIRKLLEVIDSKNPTPITSLKNPDDQIIFSKTDGQEIVQRLSESSFRFQLERCSVTERPVITVTKKVNGKFISRDFSKLSLGQQQSVLLALMLTSDSPYPLIIDQPEDNLDSEFIYHSLVPVLRRAKERRQIIIVTHNANIAVLGDSEVIFVLKSANDKGIIVDRGSIDASTIRRSTCQVLEGAEDAFKRRARTYGLL